MLATLIFGILAGWFAPKAEPHVKSAIEKVLLADAPLTPLELRTSSFAVCVLAAAIVSMIFGQPNAVVLAIGALLGVLAPRLQSTYRKTRNPDYDS